MTGENVDYQSGPYNVTFTAGEISTILYIPIRNDSVLEEDETFIIDIIRTSFNRITIGSPYQTTVTIIDNEGNHGYSNPFLGL